jgi:DNA-binding SARP family transcriptional activator/class 3 adenylate cyclase
VDELPQGTVTLLFTDVEGSTSLLRELREGYRQVLEEHQELLRGAFAARGGREVDMHGDAFFVAFTRACDAVLAAVEAQRALGAHSWPDGARVRVRIGVHTGEPTPGGDRYFGLGVHRAARICAAANGGQILVSGATRELVEEDLPGDVSLRELGAYRLKDFERPEHLFEVQAEGLEDVHRSPRAEQATSGLETIARPLTAPDGGVEISALGALEASRDGRAVDLGGPQQRALVGLLAVRLGMHVPVDSIIDALWPDGPPPSAAKIVQTYVSRLRRRLGDETIERRGSAYALRTALDVQRFEELAAAGRFVEALALWRGPALADVADVPGLRVEAERLEELRLRVLEERIDADLSAGRHADVVAELRALVAGNPLRERMRYLLMLSLYRSGRQAEALETYRDARRVLVDELGIVPGERLRALEAAILRQDRELEPAAPAEHAPQSRGAVLVWRYGGEPLEDALALAEPLAEGRELIVADLLAPRVDVAASAGALDQLRNALVRRGVAARTVCFTSTEPGADAARLARDQDAALALVPCPAALLEQGGVPRELAAAFGEVPCDVAVLAGRRRAIGGPVAVPFGAAEPDWAAVELGAWIAHATASPLRLLGSQASSGDRDASRTLATASLLLQRHLGIAAKPALTEAGPTAIVGAVADDGIVVVGLGEDWDRGGIGAARLLLLRDAAPAVVLVRRGDRPGGLAPPGAVTRFSWSRVR